MIAFLISLHFTKHRGKIHSVSVGFLFAIPLYFLFDTVVFVTAFGAYLSHLLLDSKVRL